MTLRHYVKDNDGTIVEITDRIRIAATAYAENADEGSVGTCNAMVDDRTGDFLVRGHRFFYSVEDEAAGDAYGGVIYVGWTGKRRISRGSGRAGVQRVWSLELVDVNAILSRRLNIGNDCDRPDESDLARIAWVLSTTEARPVLNDLTYVASTGGVAMDAQNFEGQSVLDVIDDCAQQSGRNYYVVREEDELTYRLWYQHDSSEERTSAIRISNVLADIDSETTFAPALESVLDRDPSRVFSGVAQQYDGGTAYVEKALTATNFVRRDTPGRAENVKKRATAVKRARRQLNDIDAELDTIPTAIIVPAAQVNAAMPGERMEVKFSHLPGYEDFRWMRIRDRTVRDLTPKQAQRLLNLATPVDGLYELALTLQAPEPGEEADGALQAVLWAAHGPYEGTSIYFEQPGDTPPAGYPARPTSAFFTPLADGTPPEPGRTYQGWTINGTGTIDVLLSVTSVGVQAGTISITYEIRRNGASVASVTSVLVKDGLGFFADGANVTATGLAVSDGDIITAHAISPTSNIAFFTVPAGVGRNDERFEITGGSLV